jgi:integrase
MGERVRPRVRPIEDAKAGPAAPTKRERAKARRRHFSEANVLTLPVKRKQYLIWDAGKNAARGLAVLISPAGAKSFRSAYYYPGSSSTITRHLGRVGEMSLADARKLCRQDRDNALKGIDPKAGDPSMSDNFAAAVADYIEREQRGRRKNAGADEAKRMLLKNYHDKFRRPATTTGEHDTKGHESAWHHRPIGTIRPQEIMKLLEFVRDGDMEHSPRPYLSNALYGHLKVFFGWCAKPGIGKLVTNPMVGIDKPWKGAKPREREWFKKEAGDKAITALWRAADELGGVEGQYLKILLLTGKRKGALSRMLWEEIDETWFWNAPQPDKKNKRLHPIPLPVLAQRILHPRKAQGFVFPGGADEGHIFVNGSGLQNKIALTSGMPDFFFHGIRHLIETKTAELRDEQKRPLILPYVRDLLFDHAPHRGSGEGYDHSDSTQLMLDALERWADHVTKLVAPEGAALLR